jgi:hypothetical protein
MIHAFWNCWYLLHVIPFSCAHSHILELIVAFLLREETLSY